MTEKFNPLDMPIMGLKGSARENVSRFEASRYLDTPETISEYLEQAMRTNDPSVLMQSLGEVAKAQGVNQLATNAGVSRESLYKTFKGGEKTRFDTVQKLLLALGVELTVKPLETRLAPAVRHLKAVVPDRPAAKKSVSKTSAQTRVKTAKSVVKPANTPAMASTRSRDADGRIHEKAKKPASKKSDSQANA